MVNSLYWVSTLTYAVVLAIILIHDIVQNKAASKTTKGFRRLVMWVVLFCLQDTFWGITAGELVMSKNLLMISSTIFHTSTVLTTFVWLSFILYYLDDRVKYKKIFLGLDVVVVAFQIILLVINIFTPTIFYVAKDGTYATAFFRPLAFANQYMVYLIICMVALFFSFIEKDENRKKYLTVFVFALAPVLSGVFQFLYPDGPFYSVGYFLGCFLVHIFIVTKDRDEMLKEQHEIRIAEQILISNTDELTGLLNRHAYESDLRKIKEEGLLENLIYVSADVNGLKIVNDTFGHAAGDELLLGAAECLKRCFGIYGKVYRIGGDEFVAIIYTSIHQLEKIKDTLDETTAAWRGRNSEDLSISCGYVSMIECMDLGIEEMPKIADERMYSVKSAYYKNRGIDRRGLQSAYVSLCEMRHKIVRANLTDDSFHAIRLNIKEKSQELGYSDKISEWLYNFSLTKQIHPDDVAKFQEKTNIEFLRAYFDSGKKSLNVLYRRYIEEELKQVIMEIIVADDYSETNQIVYIYVKDIEE